MATGNKKQATKSSAKKSLVKLPGKKNTRRKAEQSGKQKGVLGEQIDLIQACGKLLESLLPALRSIVQNRELLSEAIRKVHALDALIKSSKAKQRKLNKKDKKPAAETAKRKKPGPKPGTKKAKGKSGVKAEEKPDSTTEKHTSRKTKAGIKIAAEKKKSRKSANKKERVKTRGRPRKSAAVLVKGRKKGAGSSVKNRTAVSSANALPVIKDTAPRRRGRPKKVQAQTQEAPAAS